MNLECPRHTLRNCLESLCDFRDNADGVRLRWCLCWISVLGPFFCRLSVITSCTCINCSAVVFDRGFDVDVVRFPVIKHIRKPGRRYTRIKSKDFRRRSALKLYVLCQTWELEIVISVVPPSMFNFFWRWMPCLMTSISLVCGVYDILRSAIAGANGHRMRFNPPFLVFHPAPRNIASSTALQTLDFPEVVKVSSRLVSGELPTCIFVLRSKLTYFCMAYRIGKAKSTLSSGSDFKSIANPAWSFRVPVRSQDLKDAAVLRLGFKLLSHNSCLEEPGIMHEGWPSGARLEIRRSRYASKVRLPAKQTSWPFDSKLERIDALLLANNAV